MMWGWCGVITVISAGVKKREKMKTIVKEIILFIVTIILGVVVGMILSDLVNAWTDVSTSLETIRAVEQAQDTIFWEMDNRVAWREYQTLKRNGIRVIWEVSYGEEYLPVGK